MYTLRTTISGLCLLFSIGLSAQKNESVSDLPFSNKTEVSSQVLESLFQMKGKISIELAPEFRLEGNIQNKTSHGDAVTSILIKIENLKGSMLSLTRTKDLYGHSSYCGSLIKLHNTEGMVLVEKDQHYYFMETQQRFLVSE